MAQSAFTQSCVNVAGLVTRYCVFRSLREWLYGQVPVEVLGTLEGVDQHWLVALTRER